MKQKIKPSPAEMLILLCILAVAGIVVGLDVYTGGTPTFEETFGTAGLIIAFVYYTLKFIFTRRIEFDEDTFTVRGNTYRFREISEAEVINKHTLVFTTIIRHRTYVKIKIHVRGECVMSLTEYDTGYKEFVALLKKHKVKFHIKNSLSSWKGRID